MFDGQNKNKQLTITKERQQIPQTSKTRNIPAVYRVIRVAYQQQKTRLITLKKYLKAYALINYSCCHLYFIAIRKNENKYNFVR